MQIKDIVAGRKYISKNGEEKTRWITVGKLLIKDDGHFSLKFEDYINPGAFRNEKGEVWFNVFDQKTEKRENAPKTDTKRQPYAEPTQDERERVMADGRAYSSKWREQAQSQNVGAATEEDLFGPDECVVDGVDFND